MKFMLCALIGVARLACALALGLVVVGASAQPASAQTPGERLGNLARYPFRAIFSPRNACYADSSCHPSQQCRQARCEANPEVYARIKREQQQAEAERASTPPGLTPARPQAWESQTTVSECASDRRCRLDRLKRRNQSMLAEEQTAARAQRDLEKVEARALIRKSKALTADFRSTRMGPGFALGYALTERFHVHASIARRYAGGDYSSVTSADGTTTTTYTDITLTSFAPQLSYMLFEGRRLSPYVGAGFLYARGSADSSSYSYNDDFGFDNFGNDSEASTKVVAHAVHGVVGADFQSRPFFNDLFSLRTRLGFLVRQDIYARAATEDGTYDTATRDEVKAFFDEVQQFGFELSFGMAF